MEEGEYEELIAELKGYKWRIQKAQCRDLLDSTRPNRKRWISADRPTIRQILETFPVFRKREVVSHNYVGYVLTKLIMVALFTADEVGALSALWTQYFKPRRGVASVAN